MNRNTRLVAVVAIALLAATVASFVVYRALAAGPGGSGRRRSPRWSPRSRFRPARW